MFGGGGICGIRYCPGARIKGVGVPRRCASIVRRNDERGQTGRFQRPVFDFARRRSTAKAYHQAPEPKNLDPRRRVRPHRRQPQSAARGVEHDRLRYAQTSSAEPRSRRQSSLFFFWGVFVFFCYYFYFLFFVFFFFFFFCLLWGLVPLPPRPPPSGWWRRRCRVRTKPAAARVSTTGSRWKSAARQEFDAIGFYPLPPFRWTGVPNHPARQRPEPSPSVTGGNSPARRSRWPAS